MMAHARAAARLFATGLLAGSLVLGASVLPAQADPTATPKGSTTPSASSTPIATTKPTSQASASAQAPYGDSIRAREYWLNDYGFEDLWADATGQGATVAVIDTGVDGTHQDLKNNVLSGYDASGAGSSNGWEGLGAEPSHGTLVASLIAGHGHAQGTATPRSKGTLAERQPNGIVGVAPEAKILPISLEIGTVSPNAKSIDEQIPDAVRYAVDHGADIINLSVGSGSTQWPQSWDDAFAYAEEKDVLIIASAGNRGSGITQVGAPATIPGVLTVGGVDRSRKDSWSSSSQGISIAVTAPSEDLIAAMPDDGYALWSGTSAAAPLVTGLAALIKEQYPNITRDQLIQRIIESAHDAGEPGRNAIYGYGIIDPVAALAQETPHDATSNPLGSVREWISIHRKHSATATPSASETPVHSESEKIVDATAPQPTEPPENSGILPFIILGGFSIWVLIITAGSIASLTKTVERTENYRKKW